MRRSIRSGVIIGACLAAIYLIALGVLYFTWNDAAIARSISAWVSNPIKGAGGPTRQAFVMEYAHYPYWCTARSILVGGACPIEIRGTHIYDAEGRIVLDFPVAHARLHMGRIVWSQFFGLFGPNRIRLRFADVNLPHSLARIALTSTGEVNIVQAFSSKRVRYNPGGVVIEVGHVSFADLDFSIALAGWSTHLPHATAQGDLRYSSLPEENRDPARPAFNYSVAPIRAAHGEVKLGQMTFPLEEFAASRFGAPVDARDELRFAATTKCRGAQLTVDGRLAQVYSHPASVDLRLEAEHGGGLLALLPIEGLLRGDPHGRVHLFGPIPEVRMEGELGGGELHVAGLVGRELRTDLLLAEGKLELRRTGLAIARGHIEGSVTLDFVQRRWTGDLSARGIDPERLEPLLPEAARRFLAGRLEGRFRVGGSLDSRRHPERIRIERIGARLERSRHDRWPRVLEASGQVGMAPERIDLDIVSRAGSRLAGSVRGWIDPRRRQTSAAVTLKSPDLTAILRQLGWPDVARGFSLKAMVRGDLLQPKVSGHVSARDVGSGEIRLPRIEADVLLEQGRLLVDQLIGEGLGGSVAGEAALQLWDGPFTRPLAEPVLKAQLDATRLQLGMLVGSSALTGELAGRLVLDGPLLRPVGLAEMTLPRLMLFGDGYHDGQLVVGLDGDGLEIKHLALMRDAGGRFYGGGRIGYDGALDVRLNPQDFPLAALPPLRSLPVNLEGIISGKVRIGGHIDRWTPEGIIHALGIKVRDLLLGDGTLELVPGGDAIHLVGDFFQRFHVDGYLTLSPNLAVSVAVQFRELPLETLLPEMKKLAEVQGVISGEARFSYDAAASTSYLELRLSQLQLTLTSPGEEAGKRVDRFSNRGNIIITSDGESIDFRQVHLRSRIGELQLSGKLSSTASNLRVVGRLDLVFLEYFASEIFEHTHGSARADLTVAGNMKRPRLYGVFELDEATLEFRGADRPFVVHRGLMVFEEGAMRLDHFEVELDGARLQAQGRLALKDWQPGAVSMDIKGELSSTLLAWIVPEQIAEPIGRMGIDTRVRGTWEQSHWQGKLEFRDLAFRARKLGHDVTVPGGTVFLDGAHATFGCPAGLDPPESKECRPIVVRLDASNDVRVDGSLDFTGGALGELAIRIDGDSVEWGAAGVYSITFAPHVLLSGNGKQLLLSGNVGIVSGTYSQPFDYQALIIRPRAVESEAPFYEGTPLLEGLKLDLVMASSGPLSIKNNIANLQVTVPSLRVGGTLAQPTLAGGLLVEEGGTFKIPLLRADFVTDKGSIVFEADRTFPKETPRLDLGAWSDWSDRYDQLHHIVLKVRGTLRELDLDLSSTDGWDKPQVLSALLTGGAPDDLRRQLQSPSGGRGTTGVEGIYQTATGELLGDFLEGPLKSVFRFDVIRIELGYVKLCPYNTRYLKLCGSGEGQLTPTSRYDARLELKLADPLAIVGAAEHIEHGIETSEDIVNRGRLELKLKVPLF